MSAYRDRCAIAKSALFLDTTLEHVYTPPPTVVVISPDSRKIRDTLPLSARPKSAREICLVAFSLSYRYRSIHGRSDLFSICNTGRYSALNTELELYGPMYLAIAAEYNEISRRASDFD